MNSSESLKIIRDILPISQEQLASILHVSPSTVDRWINTKTGPSKADQKERLARLREIVELGIKVYTPEGLQKYLSTPLSEFRYQTAYN